MSDDRWGAEGPPLEAYSRVTNPERFEPIIPAILSIIDQLETTYDVDRDEGYGLDDKLERRSLSDIVRPTIRLTPRNRHAAPITVAFSSFPGIHVRFGKLTTEPYPSCGCDACDETADSEIERLNDMIHNVTRGRFREAIAEKWWARANWAPNNPRIYENLPSTSSFGWSSRLPTETTIRGTKIPWPSRKKVQEFNWQPWPLRR